MPGQPALVLVGLGERERERKKNDLNNICLAHSVSQLARFGLRGTERREEVGLSKRASERGKKSVSVCLRRDCVYCCCSNWKQQGRKEKYKTREKR